MNEAVVCFVGICTHVTRVPMTPPTDAIGDPPTPLKEGRYHRTVLVNGRLGMRMYGKGVPPHDALLVIPKIFIDSVPETLPGLKLVPNEQAMIWEMEGVSMYIADAVSGFQSDVTFNDVPSLTERSKTLSLQLDEREIIDGRAAGVFDIFAGTLGAFRFKDAMFASARIRTVPATPRLVVTRIWDEQKASITLKEAQVEGKTVPPLVFVMNVGKDADDEVDFLMHYDVTTSTPSPDAVPTANAFAHVAEAGSEWGEIIKFIPDGLTVGCSNSVYP